MYSTGFTCIRGWLVIIISIFNNFVAVKKLRNLLTIYLKRGIIAVGDNMLISFKVKNFKSFKDEITLDFTQKHDYKFNGLCVKDGLLSKCIIYGPNASGKSNLGLALFDIVPLLTDKHIEDILMDGMSYINADGKENYAEFEYKFKFKKDIITYFYKKYSPTELMYEELYVNDKKVFSYDFDSKTQHLENMELINAETLNFDYYENNLALLRYIANNTIQSDDSIVKFLMNFVSHMLWFRSLQNNGYIGLQTGGTNLSEWIIENGYVNEFSKFLYDMAGISVDLISAEQIFQNQQSKILLEKHKKNPLLFDRVASTGTRALQLLFFWTKSFDQVSLLFMDEFDAFYHYDLARNIVRYIIELDNVQAIFTTHNSFLASNELLRPDAYFKIENGKIKSFSDSTNRELREGHNLEKLLRNGEFDE